jgi:hypothetical protein
VGLALRERDREKLKRLCYSGMAALLQLRELGNVERLLDWSTVCFAEIMKDSGYRLRHGQY